MKTIKTRYQRMSLAMRLAKLLERNPNDDARNLGALIACVLSAPLPVVQGALEAESKEDAAIRDLVAEVSAEKARLP